jgi:uncharacterized protein
MTTNNPENKIDYKRVLLFLIIAISLSNIFRFDVFHIYPTLEKGAVWIYLFSANILEGSGVLISGLLGLYLLNKQRKVEISFFGTSQMKGLLMASIPVIILIVVGVENKHETDSHLYGGLAGLSTLIYCIMEEYAWRGYLQEEFKALQPIKKYALIGFIWYFWHLSFLTKASLVDNLFFLSMLIFGSWGIGKIADLTKSILAAGCFHLIVNIFMYNPFFSNGINNTKKIIILSVSILLWVILLIKWDKDNKEKLKTQ